MHRARTCGLATSLAARVGRRSLEPDRRSCEREWERERRRFRFRDRDRSRERSFERESRAWRRSLEPERSRRFDPASVSQRWFLSWMRCRRELPAAVTRGAGCRSLERERERERLLSRESERLLSRERERRSRERLRSLDSEASSRSRPGDPAFSDRSWLLSRSSSSESSVSHLFFALASDCGTLVARAARPSRSALRPLSSNAACAARTACCSAFFFLSSSAKVSMIALVSQLRHLLCRVTQ